MPARLARRRVLTGAASLLLAGPARADALSDGRFRDEVVAVLRMRYPGATITLPDDPGTVTVGASTLSLSNLFNRLRDLDPAARRAQIATYLGQVLPAGPAPPGGAPAGGRPEPFAQASARLRMQLIPPDYLVQEPSIVHRGFSPQLYVAYALDEPNRYQVVTESQLRAWGVDAAALDGPARRNSEADAEGVRIEVSGTGTRGRFATAAKEDGYAAARLLLPGFMNRLRAALGSDAIVVAVPTRDILIAWTADSERRKILAGVVRAYVRAGPYPRSDELFRSDPRGLRPLNSLELSDHGR